MKLKWHGHATFRITSTHGTSVITDPFDPKTAGYKPFSEPADIVIMSSDNDLFHCNEALVPGPHLTINALTLARSGAPQTVKDITFRAIEAMEAHNHREHHPDQNGMYIVEADGMRIGHMGDMGNALSDAQLAFFKDVDVLLALVGGHPTIQLSDLGAVIAICKPRLVVPMHFRTLTYKPRNSYWIETFLATVDNAIVDFASASEVEITPASLPASTRVLIVDYV